MRSSLLFIIVSLLAVSCHLTEKDDLKTYTTSFEYALSIDDMPENGEVTAWIPVPVSDKFQTISNLKIEPEPQLFKDQQYGNKLAHLAWKGPLTKPLRVQISYDVSRHEEVAHAEETPDTLIDRYLQPDQLGIIDERIREWSIEVTRGEESTMQKARAIYDFVLAHMTYSKEIAGWGHGDTRRACTTPNGNCSDFHALFISLARAAGIPARFHYGFSLKPGGKAGPHCWAEFLDEKMGWVPVDISEADKDPSKTEYFFGRLSENRIAVTVGRDIVLNPPQRGAPLNFLIDPYIEIDGKPLPKERMSTTTTHTSTN